MTDIPVDLIEVHEYTGLGYQPLVDYQSWRVAILRYHEELLPENMTNFQRHDETDEVFVLLEGKCILFLGEGDEQVSTVYAVDMHPGKVYNVKRGTWHTHTLSDDAMVLVVENRDTTLENSPRRTLAQPLRAQIIELTKTLWETA